MNRPTRQSTTLTAARTVPIRVANPMRSRSTPKARNLLAPKPATEAKGFFAILCCRLSAPRGSLRTRDQADTAAPNASRCPADPSGCASLLPAQDLLQLRGFRRGHRCTQLARPRLGNSAAIKRRLILATNHRNREAQITRILPGARQHRSGGCARLRRA
jgi:hypothetical protein